MRVRNDEAYAARKAEIRAEASALFRERGFAEATLDDLAERLGLTKAAIYYYFGKKDELVIDICLEAVNRSLQHVEQVRENLKEPVDQVIALLSWHISELADNLQVHATFRDYLKASDHPDARTVRAKWRTFHDTFEGVIREGQALGQIRPYDSALVTSTLLSASQGLAAWLDPGTRSTTEAAMMVSEILCLGILEPSVDANLPSSNASLSTTRLRPTK